MNTNCGTSGRERTQAFLRGEMCSRAVRGEIWPLPYSDPDKNRILKSIEFGMDFCFFARLPGMATEANSAGLAAGAVVDGPWQRWQAEAGWHEAMTSLANNKDRLEKGLASAAAAMEQELFAWREAGVDMILIADDIAYGPGPLISPADIERFLIPIYTKLCRLFSASGPAVGFHTDGKVDRILPLLAGAGFQFYSLEPEASPPDVVWNFLRKPVPLFSGVPANWLIPGGFSPELEGIVLDRWLRSGPLCVSSVCGLYHATAGESLRSIYRWLDDNQGNGGVNG